MRLGSALLIMLVLSLATSMVPASAASVKRGYSSIAHRGSGVNHTENSFGSMRAAARYIRRQCRVNSGGSVPHVTDFLR